MMKRTVAFIAAVALLAAGPAFALYSVSNKGEWPNSWPKELESLRKQSRTLVGPMTAHRHFAIPFGKREEMEAAWPEILKVKSKGAPIILVRGPNFYLGENVKAGVIVHSPPAGQADEPAAHDAPLEGVHNVRERWMNTTYIELVVDGDIVDLNRLRLPVDAPMVDERFPDRKNK